jgi:EAL domain-containing protein (putative c-di-GMP-specific phosphodiesterase class I)
VPRALPGTAAANIGSYVGMPIRTSDDSVVGMLCCADPTARVDLDGHDLSTMGMLAALLGDLLARSSTLSRQRDAMHQRVSSAVRGEGLRIALQPIIETSTGRLTGAEALARFDDRAAPHGWFADAESVGLRAELETTAATMALARLGDLEDGTWLTVNLSPDLVIDGALDQLLDGQDVSRILVEITEHAPIPDYGGLHDALDRFRRDGLQLAVDDAGAGYASFRHILNLRPDVIKVDISLVRDIDLDAAQQALVDSLLSFSDRSGAVLLAEGVERQGELDELARLGVPLVQGFLLGRPTLAGLPSRYVRAGVRPGRPPAAAG